MNNFRHAVNSIVCPTCNAKVGKCCKFEFARNEGKFHRARLLAYRETPRYKENTQKQFSRIRSAAPKKKEPKNEGRPGIRKIGISAACEKRKHSACWNALCSCTCIYCYYKTRKNS